MKTFLKRHKSWPKELAFVSKLRTIGRQRHGDNAPAETPLEYYNHNVAVPFLDPITVDLNEQLSFISNIASSSN